MTLVAEPKRAAEVIIEFGPLRVLGLEVRDVAELLKSLS